MRAPGVYASVEVVTAADKWQKVKKYLDTIKIGRGCEAEGCEWCGEFYPEMLDFDHINPNKKRAEISTMYTHTRENIDKEIAKCRVVCANCHRKLTKEARHAHYKRCNEKSSKGIRG